MHWVQTFSGKAFNLDSPSKADVRIEDIAHALALSTRFCGHTLGIVGYSIAQHSVLVSKCVDHDPVIALWALLHDAAEYVVKDMPAPLKRMPEMKPYRMLEQAVQDVICDAFDLPYDMPSSVKRYDLILLVTEKRDLMAPEPRSWGFEDVRPLTEKITPWSAAEAEQRFLERFDDLQRRRGITT